MERKRRYGAPSCPQQNLGCLIRKPSRQHGLPHHLLSFVRAAVLSIQHAELLALESCL